MASSRRKPDRLEGLAAVHLIEALRTCRLTLRDTAADLRFEAPAAHNCRMVIAAIDALAHLITGRPHLFTEQDVGTRRNQTGEEIAASATERLLDALGECRGAAIRAMTAVKVQGVLYNAIGMLTSSIDVAHASAMSARLAASAACRSNSTAYEHGREYVPWP
jgi:hypothetical protein